MTLEVSNLHVGYQTSKVLEGVSFSVGAAESVALLGRNGMGKTTLVRALCGLKPPSVTAGSITYEGKDLAKMPSHMISRAGVALVPQGRRVFGSLTTTENLTVVPQHRKVDDDHMWTVERVFDFFPRLKEREGSMARSLSGGEQQMLAIGRALMTNPSLLVMDEPSEGLAPAILDVIQDRLEGLRQQGLAILLVEQNIDLALDIAERVLIIDDSGTICWEGLPNDLANDEALLEKHLSV